MVATGDAKLIPVIENSDSIFELYCTPAEVDVLSASLSAKLAVAETSTLTFWFFGRPTVISPVGIRKKTGCTTSAHDCSDASLCTTDSCDEEGDTCVNAPVVCNSDNNACNGTEECDPATGTCHSVNPPPPCVSDGNACNGPEACDPTDGSCDSGPPVVCNDDGNTCNGPEVCDPTDGSCDSGPALVCGDGLFCTDDSCDPATGCTTTAHDCSDTDEALGCLAIIGGMVAAPELTPILVFRPPGWSVASALAGYSLFNLDLARVDAWRYGQRIGALIIHLHDGVVSCQFSDRVDD